MLFVKRTRIRSHEIGIHFHDGEFRGLLEPGTHWTLDLFGRCDINVASVRAPWINHESLDLIVDSGALKDRAVVVDLKDSQRALVWVDGRFSRILEPGVYAYWTGTREVRVEIIDASQTRFEHPALKLITSSPGSNRLLDIVNVNRHHVGLFYLDGNYIKTLPPGVHAFWRNGIDSRVIETDTRETTLDISGQEIITFDKVSLRINANVTFRIVDPLKSMIATDNVQNVIYREAQLVIRAIVGTRQFEDFLTDKASLVEEFEELVRRSVAGFGIEVTSAGIRDVILPGEIRELMNKVMEAKKAAEAHLIVRREETAAIRSQANTAKLLTDNPTLMRLRELEVLEKIAANGKMNIVLGEKGLAERVVNLI